MNDQISWDPSLVKKYSSSNYYKLLNQLRNEVKKYPLNNKKKTSSNQSREKNLVNKATSTISVSQNKASANNSNYSNDTKRNSTTINFNNSKNFSIYNHKAVKNINQESSDTEADYIKSSNKVSSPTFKDRLNQIDMK